MRKNYKRICRGCDKEFVGQDYICSTCKGWFFKFKRKAKMVTLLGGCCKLCGCKDIECLEFHHTDPKKKDYTISQILDSNYEKLMDEVEKCELLCANCHRKIHRKYKQPVVEYFIGDHDIESVANNNKQYCPRYELRKVERPSKEELEKLVWSKPSSEIRKELGLKSDSTINYWCQCYGISKPSPGYWTQQKANDINTKSRKYRISKLIEYWTKLNQDGIVPYDVCKKQTDRLDTLTDKQIYQQYKSKVVNPPSIFYLKSYS